MLEADRVTQFVLGRVDNPLRGVAVVGIKQVAGVQLDIGMQQVASGRVGFGVGQTGCPVLLPVDGGNYNVGIRFALYPPKGEGSGLIPLVNGLGGGGAQGRVAEVNVDGGAIFRPAPVGNCALALGLATILLFHGNLFTEQMVNLLLCE